MYRTRNQGAAACLLYTLGNAAHRKTFLEERPRGATFAFEDPEGRCAGIVQQYFNDHGEGGYYVDAKGIVDCFLQIRRTLTAAIENGGVWENDQ